MANKLCACLKYKGVSASTLQDWVEGNKPGKELDKH